MLIRSEFSTLQIVGLLLIVIGVLMLGAAFLWHAFIKRHDEQLLATRVANAVDEIGTPVTVLQVLAHLERKHGLILDASDVRILLDCMEAEGTLRSNRPRPARGEAEWPPRVYTLTPRFSAGFQ